MLKFLRKLISFFDKHNIPYMLSGSVALSVHALSRFTRDLDFVVHLKASDVKLLADEFDSGYYINDEAIKEAIQEKSMFNIIDHASGYKADFIILKPEPYRQVEFKRRRQVNFAEMGIYIVSQEDLLISKLIWIQDSQSPLQIEDIKALKEIDDMDWPYINEWTSSLKLNTFGLF